MAASDPQSELAAALAEVEAIKSTIAAKQALAQAATERKDKGEGAKLRFEISSAERQKTAAERKVKAAQVKVRKLELTSANPTPAAANSAQPGQASQPIQNTMPAPSLAHSSESPQQATSFAQPVQPSQPVQNTMPAPHAPPFSASPAAGTLQPVQASFMTQQAQPSQPIQSTMPAPGSAHNSASPHPATSCAQPFQPSQPVQNTMPAPHAAPVSASPAAGTPQPVQASVMAQQAQAPSVAPTKVGASAARGQVPGANPTSAAASQEDWAQHVDPQTGKTFYFNAKTGVTSWDKPCSPPAVASAPATKPLQAATLPTKTAAAAPAIASAAASAAKIDDWAEHVDPQSGKTFFHNKASVIQQSTQNSAVLAGGIREDDSSAAASASEALTRAQDLIIRASALEDQRVSAANATKMELEDKEKTSTSNSARCFENTDDNYNFELTESSSEGKTSQTSKSGNKKNTPSRRRRKDLKDGDEATQDSWWAFRVFRKSKATQGSCKIPDGTGKVSEVMSATSVNEGVPFCKCVECLKPEKDCKKGCSGRPDAQSHIDFWHWGTGDGTKGRKFKCDPGVAY